MGRPLDAEAADVLLQRKEELASEITARLYAAVPELLDRYGERGRMRCLEDMRYNIEHLAPAVSLGEHELFVRYVGWLQEMLSARGVPAGDVRRSLQLTRDVVRERLADDAQEIVLTLDAGLAALGDDGL